MQTKSSTEKTKQSKNSEKKTEPFFISKNFNESLMSQTI